MNTTDMIVKIQRPLYSTEPNQLWLVYNKRRTYVRYIATKNIPRETLADIGDDLKAYFEVQASRTSKVLGFIARVEDQPW